MENGQMLLTLESLNTRKKDYENQAILSGSKFEVCKGTFCEKWQNKQDVLHTAFLAVFYNSRPPTAQRPMTSRNIYWCILSTMSQQSATPILMTWCTVSHSLLQQDSDVSALNQMLSLQVAAGHQTTSNCGVNLECYQTNLIKNFTQKVTIAFE